MTRPILLFALLSSVFAGVGVLHAAAFEQAVVAVETDRGGVSGFLVKTDGTLATTARGIAGARWVRVRLADGELFQRVFLLTADTARDLALLRVEGFDLPVLNLGNSSGLTGGEAVQLLGRAGDKPAPALPARVTGAGVDQATGIRWLELDIAVPKAYQGGPLLNERSEVVGLLTRQGPGQGGAAPVNSLRALIDGLPVTLAAAPPQLLGMEGKPSAPGFTAVLGSPAPPPAPAAAAPAAPVATAPPGAPVPVNGFMLSGYGDSPQAIEAAFQHLRRLLEARGRPIATTVQQAREASRAVVEIPELLERLRQGGGKGLFYFDARIPAGTGQTCRLKVRHFDEAGREIWEVHTSIAAAATLEEGARNLVDRLAPKLMDKF